MERSNPIEERLEELERAIKLTYCGMPLDYVRYWLLKRQHELEQQLPVPEKK